MISYITFVLTLIDTRLWQNKLLTTQKCWEIAKVDGLKEGTYYLIELVQSKNTNSIINKSDGTQPMTLSV